MIIEVAKSAGFCYGVQRAYEMALDFQKEMKQDIYTYGELIHNSAVIEELESKGIKSLEALADADSKNLLIRAHGVSPEVMDGVLSQGFIVRDATCPHVKRIHHIVEKAGEENYEIIVIGDEKHPEVIGICGYAENTKVINSLEEARQVALGDKVCSVAQTTLNTQLYKEIINILKERATHLKEYNTICNATEIRQREVIEMAKRCDLILVIGGKKSSNTKKLYELALKYGKKALHIEKYLEIPFEILEDCDKIGLVAGASTPKTSVELVLEFLLRKFNKITKELGMENNVNKTMQEMLDDYDQAFRVPRRGDVIEDGKVFAITKDAVFVNIGYKADGIIPLEEVALEDGEKLEDVFEEGQVLDVYVLKPDNGDGNVLLSVKKLAMDKDFKELEPAFENQSIVKVTIKQVVKGGLIAYYKNVRGFIPASHISLRYENDLNKYIGEEVEARVIEYDKRKRRTVFSRKDILKDEIKEKKNEFFEHIEIGQIIEGTVKRLANFGAFVDIGGFDGLVYVTEITHGRIKHPSDKLKINDVVKVKVLKIDPENEKVSLSIKQTESDPWTDVEKIFVPGSVHEGKVVNTTDFGAFIELAPGVEGLVHISQISKQRVKNPQDVLKTGEVYEFEILEIDLKDQKIKLSCKNIGEDLADDEPHSVEELANEVAEAAADEDKATEVGGAQDAE